MLSLAGRVIVIARVGRGRLETEAYAGEGDPRKDERLRRCIESRRSR